MKWVRLLCSIIALTLLAGGCKSKSTRMTEALCKAAAKGDIEQVKLLIAEGADINAKDEYTGTPLHYAASGGHTNVVEFLLSSGADINAARVTGHTPLWDAAWEDRKDVVEFLIKKGANVEPKSHGDNYTLLHDVAARGLRDMAELLLAGGADVNTRDNQGRTPLWYARNYNRKEMYEFLQKHGAKE